MTQEKFNPISQLATLPGTDIAIDMEPHTEVPKYPPTEVADKDSKKPQIEIRLKPADSKDPEEIDPKEEKESKRLLIVRSIILVCLIVLVFVGIFLTLRIVPKILTGMSNFSQSFGTYISEKINSTSTPTISGNVPAYVPPSTIPLTTSTTTIANINPIAYPQPATTYPVTKTPAKLSVNIMSVNTIGSQTYIKFNVQNIGGMPSGAWSFSATLPSSITPQYNSQTQYSLTPQSGVIYTLGFTANPNQNVPVQITLYTSQGTSNSSSSY